MKESVWENSAYWVGLCKGIVSGTVGGMSVSEVDLQGTNQGQLIPVVENYLQSHPELLNKDAGWLVRQALKKAFPPK